MMLMIQRVPKEYVKDLTDAYNKAQHKDDSFAFEQALWDVVATHKMDEEPFKGGHLGALGHSPPEDKEPDQAAEYAEAHVWTGDWDRVCGFTEKRGRQEEEEHR